MSSYYEHQALQSINNEIIFYIYYHLQNPVC